MGHMRFRSDRPGGLDPDDLAPAVSGAGLAAHMASVSNRSISRDTLCWPIRRRCSTFAFGNYPWPLASDVERAFHPCNISSKETNDRGDNSHETDMVRPFRISHRGGRGQDPDRSVSVR